MKDEIKVLALSGSLRKDSFNKKLMKIAAAGARKAGASVTIIDLQDYPLPLYNADIERDEGLPENAIKLKRLFVDHQGFLLASPEYNSSISGVFKNAIDWISRPEEGDPVPLVAFKGKVAALMSASPGVLGGIRGLAVLRAILGNIGVFLLPEQVTVAKANEAFNAQGQLKNPVKLEKLLDLGASLARNARKLTL